MAKLPYPPTRTADTTDILHGEPVADPYRWLEEGESEETRDWTARQNALTEAYLNAAPVRQPIRRRLGALLEIAKAPRSRASSGATPRPR
jgi:prolyl oligopeptidase